MTDESFPVRRFRRMTAALSTLQGRTMTANELARNLGVSRRTIFRDLAVLRSCGFDILADPATQRLKLLAAPDGSIPFSVSDRQLLQLAIALSVAAGVFPVLTQLYPLISTLTGGQNASSARRFAGLPEFIELPDCCSSLPEWLLLGLVRSYLARTSIRVTCQNVFGTEPCTTLFSPYRLRLVGQGWSAIGRSSLHKKVVSIPAASITALEQTAYTFAIPPRFTSGRDKR